MLVQGRSGIAALELRIGLRNVGSCVVGMVISETVVCGLPDLFAVYVPACTYEADNVVLLLQSNESCMMQTMKDTRVFKNYVRAVFTSKKSDALPPCLNVPYNRKSNISLGSLGRRSRGKSIASSSRNVGSEVVVGELGNNQSIIPQSKHYRDAHNHSEAISSDLKRLLPMMGINMEACCPVSCYVTNSDTRVSMFVNGDDKEKMAMIHLAVQKMQKYSHTQYALDNTARQLLLGDTQEMEQ